MAVYVPVPVPQRTSQPVIQNLSESDFNNPYANARFTAQAKGGVRMQQLLQQDIQTRAGEMDYTRQKQQADLQAQQQRYWQEYQRQQQERNTYIANIASMNDPTALSNTMLANTVAQQGTVTIGQAKHFDRSAHEIWRAAQKNVQARQVVVDPGMPPRPETIPGPNGLQLPTAPTYLYGGTGNQQQYYPQQQQQQQGGWNDHYTGHNPTYFGTPYNVAPYF